MSPISPECGRAERGSSARVVQASIFFSYFNCVVNLDTEIPDRTFDLGVAEQQLNGPKIAGSPIDQRCLGSAQRVDGVTGRRQGSKPLARYGAL